MLHEKKTVISKQKVPFATFHSQRNEGPVLPHTKVHEKKCSSNSSLKTSKELYSFLYVHLWFWTRWKCLDSK